VVEMKGWNRNTFAKIPFCVKGLMWLDKGPYTSLFSNCLPVPKLHCMSAPILKNLPFLRWEHRMNKRYKIAFTIYLAICLLGFAFGIAYLACSTIMPYHHQAIGIDWEDLGPGLQVMLRNFVNFAGAGFITGYLSCLIMLLIPFRG